MIIIWPFIWNSPRTFFHLLKQNSLLPIMALMPDVFRPFFTSYEQKVVVALARSVPRCLNFLSSLLCTRAKATCIWGRVRKELGQENPFLESNLFHLWINKYCEWGIAVLSSLNTTRGKETGENQREKTHLNLMSRGKQIIGGNFCLSSAKKSLSD